MVIKDIMSRKSYTKDGVEKASWLKVGTLRTTDQGKSFIELNMFPGVSYFVFDQKPKDEAVSNKGASPANIDWAE